MAAYSAEYFGGGEYEFARFPGMGELVRDLGASDMSLALATAKPFESAERVLIKAGLIDCFDSIGVPWGDSDEGELASVAPTHIVSRTDQIRVILGLRPFAG